MSDDTDRRAPSAALIDALMAGEVEIEAIPSAPGDPGDDDPFRPTKYRYLVKGEVVDRAVLEGFGLDLDGLNAAWTAIRDRIYERKKANPNYWRVLAVGDSWFHYPFGSDLIELFLTNFAVKTLARAGDRLDRMLERRDYRAQLAEVKPALFMISAGGNDLLGKEPDGSRNLLRMLKPNGGAGSRLTDEYHRTVDRVIRSLEDIRGDAVGRGFDGATVVHGYAYACPESGRGSWLAEPLRQRGYNTPEDRRLAMAEVVDTFNGLLRDYAAGAASTVLYADARVASPKRTLWFDEIHPSMNNYSRFIYDAFGGPIYAWLAERGRG